MFIVGAQAAMEKRAALDTTVHEVVSTVFRSHMPKGHEPGQDDELETLLPEDGDLEAAIAVIEENFDVQIPDKVMFTLLAEGRIRHLEKAIIRELTTMKKEADHRYYMQHRAQMQQRSRQYRMRNIHQIRRRSRIYRRKVKRRQIRPRRRVGTRGGGYTFIVR